MLISCMSVLCQVSVFLQQWSEHVEIPFVVLFSICSGFKINEWLCHKMSIFDVFLED